MIPVSDSEPLSPLVLARIIGIVGLAGIATGAFDIGYVQNHLIVAGNASATLHNLAAHETLFRAGFSAHLFEMLLNIIEEILGFFLFWRVNRIVATISLCCGFIGIAIESVDLLFAYVPLKLAIAGNVAHLLDAEQLQALSNLSTELQQSGLLLSWAFYGIDELTAGFLVFCSGFLPRILGVLLGISGACYFTHSFLSFLAPSLDAKLYPYILYPCAPGEILFSLWLATRGLNIAKWRERGRSQTELSLACGRT
jgi:Domain of unknown function (DUF4386)